MKVKDFELFDNDTIDNSIIKRKFNKVYRQQRAILNNLDQNLEFISDQNTKSQQRGNEYLKYDITIRKPADTTFLYDASRLINNAFAFTFKEARLLTTGGSDFEQI